MRNKDQPFMNQRTKNQAGREGIDNQVLVNRDSVEYVSDFGGY
jgi:hypothetical protein